jgi:hypothetical protein
MGVFLIDPTTKAIQDVETELTDRVRAATDKHGDASEALIEVIRSLIGDPQQILFAAIAGGRLVLALDNYGLLRSNQLFWHLSDNVAGKFGGKALLLAVAPEGYLTPVADEVRAGLEASVVWDEGVSLLKLVERILVKPGEPPQIARIPVFSDDPDPEILKQMRNPQPEDVQPPDDQPPTDPSDPQNVAPNSDASHLPAREGGVGGGALGEPLTAIEGSRLPQAGWTVQTRPDGSARAVRYVLEGDKLSPAAMMTAPTLALLREQRPAGLRTVEPSDEDGEDVVELWVSSA